MGESSLNPGSDRKWWYCLRHNTVEFGPGCPDRVRLGPFETEAEAATALQRAAARNEEWEEHEKDDQ